MTLISPTAPEPLCDIRAQLAALGDPAHPKRAVWVARGTTIPIPLGLVDVCAVSVAGGTLFARDWEDCQYLLDDPSDETLATILGYIEPKSEIIAQPAVWWPVVQARNVQGCVVWEQLSSWQRVAQTTERARLYGRLAVCTMDECTQRRVRLIAAEEKDSCQKAPRSPRLRAS
jgi:hypothetical protein